MSVRDHRPSILHVSQPTTGGVARLVGVYAADQLTRSWDVTVASPPGELATTVREAGARHVPWAAGREPTASVVREVRRLAVVVRDVQPDLVHLHSSKAGLAGRLLLRGRRPTLFQPHGWSFYAARGVVMHAALQWERAAQRWADAIVCVSDGEREAADARGIHGRFRVIPSGVDTNAFRPQDRARARQALGLPDEPLAVCVGRLAHAKGQDVLLAAWPHVLASVPEARLALVGNGDAEGSLRHREAPRVEFLGHRRDVDRWLAAANVVVVPSRWEGFPLALLEAMASGRSVVASSVSGVNDMLEKGGGAIVPPEDVGALAAALVARLGDPGAADAEGARGRELVARTNDVRAHCESLAALYADLLSAGRS